MKHAGHSRVVRLVLFWLAHNFLAFLAQSLHSRRLTSLCCQATPELTKCPSWCKRSAIAAPLENATPEIAKAGSGQPTQRVDGVLENVVAELID